MKRWTDNETEKQVRAICAKHHADAFVVMDAVGNAAVLIEREAEFDESEEWHRDIRALFPVDVDVTIGEAYAMLNYTVMYRSSYRRLYNAHARLFGRMMWGIFAASLLGAITGFLLARFV